MQLAYRNIVDQHQNLLWEALSTKTISHAVVSFLDTLSFHTKRSYACGFRAVFDLLEVQELMRRDISLQAFALCNMENLLDCIKTHLVGSESTKQARCAMFVSFTRYLERASGGIVRSAKPLVGTHKATFKKIRNKSTTEALTHAEWGEFLIALQNINPRDALIARAIFQGAKRVSEVLSSSIDHINWEKNQITYTQVKSATLIAQTTINYSEDFMKELKRYLNGRTGGHIFGTRNGTPVTQPHLHRNFSYASIKAGLNKRVHPHMLRTTAITLLMGMGHHSDQIMKVSGHSSPQAVLYYDKSELEDNPTKYTKLC